MVANVPLAVNWSAVAYCADFTMVLPPPPAADITPPLIVMVEPSGLTQPSWAVVAVVQEIAPEVLVMVAPSVETIPLVVVVAMATAGDASLLMNVVAVPLTAAAPAVAVGLAADGTATEVQLLLPDQIPCETWPPEQSVG